ncbi:MAG: nucleoside triphosphate pyrophosphohydrolase, partial [Bacteroidia bacterium]|nr:nucleoside triphosphate pyrophosphohydrolase [Bacteroidia bacterium]MDW8333934.1 nucleoside triphosphate pyrophosphohydrolase [Bacteroidia bacterium]
ERCPWDRAQTLESLRHLTIEETYELSEALIAQNHDELKKELGDLLLHIVFYCKIASESDLFDAAEVIESLCDKLIRRHPHVYGEMSLNSPEAVAQNWEKIKRNESPRSTMTGVPQSAPALIKALRIQEKAAGIGFDWTHVEPVVEKIREELNELQNASENDREEEFGDLLFSLVNYARFLRINPDDALEKANQKFLRRFAEMEKRGDLAQMTPEEMDGLWETIKREERTANREQLHSSDS